MNAARQIVNRMLDDMPDDMIENVIEYIAFIQNVKRSRAFEELEYASISSTGFWNSPNDDEAWNNV